jgi:hypothetical protein
MGVSSSVLHRWSVNWMAVQGEEIEGQTGEGWFRMVLDLGMNRIRQPLDRRCEVNTRLGRSDLPTNYGSNHFSWSDFYLKDNWFLSHENEKSRPGLTHGSMEQRSTCMFLAIKGLWTQAIHSKCVAVLDLDAIACSTVNSIDGSDNSHRFLATPPQNHRRTFAMMQCLMRSRKGHSLLAGSCRTQPAFRKQRFTTLKKINWVYGETS